MLKYKRKVIWMRRSKQQQKTNRDNGENAVPIKYRYPNLVTYDPYLVEIVKMLEQMKKQKKH